jgi:hypothetical protein
MASGSRELFRIARAAALVGAAVAALSLGLGDGVAAGTQLACGDTVDADVVLRSDLYCPQLASAALVVAPGVTLDLAGHTIGGDGTGFGLHVTPGGSARNGTVTGFSTGVRLAGGTLERVSVVRNAGSGVLVIADNAIVRSSTVGRNGAFGIFDGGWRGLVVSDSKVVDNAADGIFAAGFADVGRYETNFVARNGGAGIHVDTSTSSVVGNQVQRNAGSGIWLEEHLGALFGPGYVIAANSSDSNGDTGISACIVIVDPAGSNPCGAGMTDGGGNEAKLNAGTQCLNVVCAATRGQARRETVPPLVHR